MRIALFILAFTSFGALAKETPAADCKYLMMSPTAVREAVQSLLKTEVPKAKEDRQNLVVE